MMDPLNQQMNRYSRGTGIARDDVKALEYFKKSIERHDDLEDPRSNPSGDAENCIGFAYELVKSNI
jgi:hypothetical protein